MIASETGTDRASMPDENSEEPPSPDLRSMLTLHTQRQQQVTLIFPYRHFACAAALFACAAAR